MDPRPRPLRRLDVDEVGSCELGEVIERLVALRSAQVGFPVAVEDLKRPPHDLNVLLRHRLLRKAGGFEGLLSGCVLLHPPDSSVLKADEARERVANRLSRFAPLQPTPGMSLDGHDLVSDLDDLFRLGPKVSIEVCPGIEEGGELGDAANPTGDAQVLVLEIRMAETGE